MSEQDFEIVRGCLNGEIHWEGVGPRPWWAPLDRIRARMEALDAIESTHLYRWIERAQVAEKRVEELETLRSAAESVYLGFTCPQDPMDCDERLERLSAALNLASSPVGTVKDGTLHWADEHGVAHSGPFVEADSAKEPDA